MSNELYFFSKKPDRLLKKPGISYISVSSVPSVRMLSVTVLSLEHSLSFFSKHVVYKNITNCAKAEIVKKFDTFYI